MQGKAPTYGICGAGTYFEGSSWTLHQGQEFANMFTLTVSPCLWTIFIKAGMRATFIPPLHNELCRWCTMGGHCRCMERCFNIIIYLVEKVFWLNSSSIRLCECKVTALVCSLNTCLCVIVQDMFSGEILALHSMWPSFGESSSIGWLF